MPHSTTAAAPARPRTPSSLPPFPSGLPEAPIQRISLEQLMRREPAAEQELWEACHTRGFFYLDLGGGEPEPGPGLTLASGADELERLSHGAFRLPAETKQAAAMARWRSLFGYKGPGIVAKEDPHRRRDVGEFWNLSKDDVLGQSSHPVAYPELLQEARPLLADFMRAAHEVGLLVLEILATRLGIPAGQLASKHRLDQPSGDHVRLTYGPGNPEAATTTATATATATAAQIKEEADTRITTFAHTDFGSVTLLFNWLGGLQIENHDDGGDGGKTTAATATKSWEWVRPVPGHAICNLGDAMREFAGGRVASGRHRVVAAPGAQAALDRYSVVYFVRPEDSVVLEDLTPGAARKPEAERWTAVRWIEERSRALGNDIRKND
ncbi:hypothetical protein SLS62_004889 [Diatrype stigma]|uniref:Fe2OG dioxygenase domain-containing protein n=1 Tax=Diatrype stigma TaxID=117547 RepID=A0AAN9YQ50_9PEZI